ncbi:MAG: hypothetical protein N2038_07615 [Geminicoccaceae bacterium]|nr:hypothetical protein [Geminicoccaceae bacterium]MCS7266654.1 hypothetical protein [Geminicoccaceae bacterium]MCX7630102.1 hypothetical protein [Geminicoccaceae bacterium]MDW8123287.1 hypothetical protein [Geminicoccaceae bacterium]MDW8340412.1 hypothetical protein [Geminicoccaceae bacterium]
MSEPVGALVPCSAADAAVAPVRPASGPGLEPESGSEAGARRAPHPCERRRRARLPDRLLRGLVFDRLV